jgi:hypothetical protein
MTMSLLRNSLLLGIFSDFKFFYIHTRCVYAFFVIIYIYIRWWTPIIIVEESSDIIMFSRIVDGFGIFFFGSQINLDIQVFFHIKMK